MKHKRVITIGDASYTIDGIVKRVHNIDELADALSLTENSYDDDLIDHFLYYIKYHYSVEGSWRTPTKAHYSSVSTRITDIMTGQFS